MKSARQKAAQFLAAIALAALVMFSGVAPVDAGDSNSGTINWEPTDEQPVRLSGCRGTPKSSINDAKASYQTQCGEAWRYNSGHHRCMWISAYGGRWSCWHIR